MTKNKFPIIFWRVSPSTGAFWSSKTDLVFKIWFWCLENYLYLGSFDLHSSFWLWWTSLDMTAFKLFVEIVMCRIHGAPPSAAPPMGRPPSAAVSSAAFDIPNWVCVLCFSLFYIIHIHGYSLYIPIYSCIHSLRMPYIFPLDFPHIFPCVSLSLFRQQSVRMWPMPDVSSIFAHFGSKNDLL